MYRWWDYELDCYGTTDTFVFSHLPYLSTKEPEMALDGSVLGNLAAQQMAALERDYDGDSDAQVGAVITIVEILTPQGTDPQGNTQFASAVRLRHNVGDPYRAIGVMRAAEHNITDTAFGDTTTSE
jgi:hypothetical protein